MKNQAVRITLALLVCFLCSGLQPAASAVKTGLTNAPVETGTNMADSSVTLSALIALANQHLKSVLDGLEILAMTREVQSGEWNRMSTLLSALEKRSVPATVLFARPHGAYYVAGKGMVPYNIRDRAYFQKALSGEAALGELVVSRSTGLKSVVAAVPVKKGRRIVGVLAAAIHLEELSRILKEELALPPNMVFFALNEDGLTALSWKADQIFTYPAQQGSETLKEAVAVMLADKEGMVEYDLSGKRRVIFKTSPFTGWRFGLGYREIRPIQ